MWVLLSQQLVPDKSQMPQECRLCSHSVTNPHCTAPLGRQCGKCQCSQIWSPRRTVSITHSKAGEPEPGARVARGQHPPPEVAESCDTWQALVLQGFDCLPYLWLLFSLEKESSQQKKSINTKAKKRAASKLHYFTWSFSSHHRKQLFFSRKIKKKMVVHLSPSCGNRAERGISSDCHHLWDSKQLRDHLYNPSKACRARDCCANTVSST